MIPKHSTKPWGACYVPSISASLCSRFVLFTTIVHYVNVNQVCYEAGTFPFCSTDPPLAHTLGAVALARVLPTEYTKTKWGSNELFRKQRTRDMYIISILQKNKKVVEKKFFF